MVLPLAEITGATRDRAGLLRCLHKVLKAASHTARIGCILRQIKPHPHARAQFDMGTLWHLALHISQQVRVEHKLQQMFGIRALTQFGIDHLVGIGPQRRGPLHPLQKIGPSPPGRSRTGTSKGGLIDHVSPGLHRLKRGHRRGTQPIVASDFCDGATIRTQPVEIALLMHLSLCLQERGVFPLRPWSRPLPQHMRTVQRSCVTAGCKLHQVGCRELECAVSLLHGGPCLSSVVQSV